MNLDSIDPNSINEILSSLSDEDIEGLKNMAQSIFSQNEGGEQNNQNFSQSPPQAGGFSSGIPNFDFASMAKLASFMNLISNKQKDPRCDLLYALRPLLTDEKKPKVDQAVRMLELMSIIPKLKELNLGK